MLKDIIQIVASVTGLGIPDYMPPIVRLDSSQEMAEKCSRGANACFAVRSGIATIYVGGKFLDDKTGVGDAVIAHEVVHFFQYYHGQFDTFECQKESEYDAYRVSNVIMASYSLKRHTSNQIKAWAKCD